MVKKKQKNQTTQKTELLIAIGIVLLLMSFGLVVAWLDHNDGFVGHSRQYTDVTISGDAGCLPLKDKQATQSGDKCVQGIRTTSGVYYAIDGTLTRDDDNHATVTGLLKAPSRHTDYNTVGVLEVR